jgi:hypothetical protein
MWRRQPQHPLSTFGADPLRWRRATACAVAVVFAVAGCSGGGGLKRDKDGHVTSAGDLSVFDLRAGDCITPPGDVKAELDKVRVVPCKDGHTQEAFAVQPYDKGDAYPGDQALTAFADGVCLEQYQGYVGVAYQDSKLFYTYLLPSARSWNEGKDRKIVCIVTTTGEQLTASVKDSRK